jgi:hypothetical protein
MRKALSILFLIVGVFYGVHAQSDYPIYVTPTLIPPYSLKLSDYSKFGSQQLVVNIVVNDLNIANLPVKLRIKLETVGVTIENPPTINTTPIYLDGGAAIVLSGDDLTDYFNINNLIFKGYGKEAYRRSGQLPEGFYKISVEVLHFQTNRLISNQGSATAWIALGKPPILKLPENNKEMGEFKGMPIVFSWLPSNVGSPISANSIQYKFEMWEMRVDGISPYVVASSVPVFHDEITQNTNISLIPSSLLMEPGMKYAWRITASDLSGYVPFEQDGHSEIRVFTYKAKCDSVTNLSVSNIAKNGIFKWAPRENHTAFNVEMRNPVTGWSLNSQTFDSKAEFSDLDYGAKYEMRVQAVCDGDPESVSDFSQWKTLVIPQKRINADSAACPTCKCDDNLGIGNIDNIELRKDLKPGDTLVNRYGTTRFIVKSVEPQGDGVYKGQFLFWAELWKLKFICNYWDLSVNTNNVIVNMDYESVYNPQYLFDVDATTKYLDKLAGDITTLTVNATIKDTISVNETITSIYVNAGDSLIAVTVGPDGELHEVVIQPDTKNIEKTMVKGENGEEYVVNRDGEVMGVKEYQNSGGGNNRMMNDYINKKESEQLSSSTEVQFTASQNQKYGFDSYTNEKQALVTQYPTLNNGYSPAYKSMASYSPDRVNISSAGNGITFRDEMGIPAIVSGNELTIRGGTDGATTALYAYKAVNDSTEEIAGKLNIMSYDEQIKKVYIIPVNRAQMPEEAALQQTLNTIYGQAVTRWEVTKIDKGLTVTFENGNMTHGGSNAISVYNTDQKSIISKFKETDDFEKDALYLFFVDNVQSKTDDIAGFMPLQRQVGFIYDNPNEYIIAHELAHGAFNLRHTFSPEKLIAQKGTTKNLMDYNSGTELWKHQWDFVHDPDNILFAWAQGEEDGEGATPLDNKIVLTVFDQDNLKCYYCSESGVTLPQSLVAKIKDDYKNWGTVDVIKACTAKITNSATIFNWRIYKNQSGYIFAGRNEYDYKWSINNTETSVDLTKPLKFSSFPTVLGLDYKKTGTTKYLKAATFTVTSDASATVEVEKKYKIELDNKKYDINTSAPLSLGDLIIGETYKPVIFYTEGESTDEKFPQNIEWNKNPNEKKIRYNFVTKEGVNTITLKVEELEFSIKYTGNPLYTLTDEVEGWKTVGFDETERRKLKEALSIVNTKLKSDVESVKNNCIPYIIKDNSLADASGGTTLGMAKNTFIFAGSFPLMLIADNSLVIQKDDYDLDIPIFKKIALDEKSSLIESISRQDLLNNEYYKEFYGPHKTALTKTTTDPQGIDIIYGKLLNLKSKFKVTEDATYNAFFKELFDDNVVKYKSNDYYQKASSDIKKEVDDLISEFYRIEFFSYCYKISDERAKDYISLKYNQEIMINYKNIKDNYTIGYKLKLVLAHEIGHLYFTQNNIGIAWKWSEHSKWQKRPEGPTFNYPTIGDANCSNGAGHDYNNPSGRCACNNEKSL